MAAWDVQEPPTAGSVLPSRRRGRGPSDCTWDVQLGSWLRADGSAWMIVRNEKRDRAREAQRVKKWAKQDERRKTKAERGLLEQSRKDQSRKDRESLKHVKEERLRLKSEVREAREAEAEARGTRACKRCFLTARPSTAPSNSTSSTPEMCK